MAIHSSENEPAPTLWDLLDELKKLAPLAFQDPRAPARLREDAKVLRQKKFDALPQFVKDFKGAWDGLSLAVQDVEKASGTTLSQKISDLGEARQGMANLIDDNFEQMLEAMELPGPVQYDV